MLKVYVDVFSDSKRAWATAQEHFRKVEHLVDKVELRKKPFISLTFSGIKTYYLPMNRALDFVRGIEIIGYNIRSDVEAGEDRDYLREVLESRKRG